MNSSKDVFAMRKSGHIDEAYAMAITLIQDTNHDDWDIRALGWCLIDLIKRDINAKDNSNINNYIQQLKMLNIPSEDKILSDQRTYTLRLLDPIQQEIIKAKNLSKLGLHNEAINIYKNIIQADKHNNDIQLNLAWELYRISKNLIDQKPPNFMQAKRYLHDYMSLTIEKPSLIHSLILRNALEIAKQNKLNLVSFIQLWDIDNFQRDDYQPFITMEGRKLPSLVESTLLHVLKEVISQKNIEAIEYLSEFLEKCILQFPDNIWLKMRKSQIFLLLEKYEDAFLFAKTVVKNKSNESWAWGLLSSTLKTEQIDQKISCYCKALLCSNDLNFVAKLKIHLAKILSYQHDYIIAKTEIEEVIAFKKANDQKIPEEALLLMEQHWYRDSDQNTSNYNFYIENSSLAEELLYEDLPWIKANLGDTFTKERKDKKSKKMRNIFVKSVTLPIKLSIDEAKINILSTKKFGDTISVKCEHDNKNNLQIVSIKERQFEKALDIFTHSLVVVDYVNIEKNTIGFILDKNINGQCKINKSNSKISVGDSMHAYLYQYQNKYGKVFYSAINIEKSNVQPPTSLVQTFESTIERIPSFAFTENNYFVPAHLVEKNKLLVGDKVKGKVILNYDKKKFEWGWKVFEIEKLDHK